MKKTTPACAHYAALSGLALVFAAGCQTAAPKLQRSVASAPSFQGQLQTAWVYAPTGANNGFVHSGPVVAGNRVYTPNGLNRVVALNAADGGVVWEAVLQGNVFSVAADSGGNRLFATTTITAQPTPTLYALNPESGEVLWNNQAHGQSAIGGIESAPVVKSGVVYAAYLRYEGFGGVCAFNAQDGLRRWCYKRERFSPMSPLVFSQGRLYVSFDDRTLICLDANRGSLLWSFDGPRQNLHSAPAVAGGEVLAAWGESLYSLDAASGKLKWVKPLEATVEMSSPKIAGVVSYVGTREGELLAIQARDGSVLRRVDLQSGALNSSPVIDPATQIVWIGSASNELVGVSMQKGEVVKRYSAAKDSSLGFWRNSPVISGNRLFIGSTNKRFYAIAPVNQSQ